MANLDGKALNALAEIGGDGAITKSDIGLGNVDNTSDANKPISSATQIALNAKAPIASPAFTGTVSGITKSMVGLGNVDNTSDTDKPVSTAVRTELDAIKENVLVNTNEIADIENVLNSMNPNQEARTTVSGVDTISLPKTAANTGMQVQLFGQSAENLVVNGDFRSGTTGWSSVAGTQSVVNGNLLNTGTGGLLSPFSQVTVGLINTNKYYIKSYARVTNSVCTDLRLRLFGVDSEFIIISSPVQNQWYSFSKIVTATSTANQVLYLAQAYVDAATALGKVMEIDYLMLINLTSTFGAGNEPTKEQCDILFANYFEGSDNVLSTGRVRSVGKNLFNYNDKDVVDGYLIAADGSISSNSNAYLTGFIKVKPNTTYVFNRAATSYFNFYDNNKQYLSTSALTSTSVTTPANCYYIRTYSSYSTKDKTALQIEMGSLATTYEPFRQSALYLQSPELRSNGTTKDEIRKGTNGYELVKRVGVGTLGANGVTGGDFEGGLIGTLTIADEVATWTLNTTNPISGTKDGLLQVTTVGTGPYRPLISTVLTRASGQLRKFSFKYKVNSGTFILAGFNTGSGNYLIPITLTGSGTYQRYYVADGANGFAIFLDGRNLFNAQIDDVKDELVAVAGLASGTGATVVTTELGSNVHYTLATPTITPIAHGGLLNSNQNGTTYFEPVVADAGVYGTNLAIQLTDYPIASFESIRKYANGTYTELSTATAVIAGDGLSFTHTGLTSGDLVMFTYNYNKESVGRSMTLTHYDNRYVIADTANSKVYRWIISSTNGVPSIVLTEV